MGTLRHFGGVVLEGTAGPLTGRAVQRRRLAILVLLASSPGHTLSRDRLVSLLWPESDPESGRHLLSSALYELRKALGESSILSSGDDLRLNASVVHTDTGEFEAALARGDLERAVALYAGPFADGFHVGGAPLFEEWLESTRGSYRQRYLAALESLAESSVAAGSAAHALEWWRHLAHADPYATRPVLGLMRAHAAVGNHAAAILHARAHADRLRQELDADPDPAVLDLMAELRHRPIPASRRRPTPADDAPDSVTELGHEIDGVRQGSTPIGAPAAPAVARTSRARPVSRPIRSLALLAFVAGTVLVASWWMSAYAPTSPDVVDSRVAVFPFSVHGSPELAYLGEGMADLLSVGLDGAGEVRTVKPEALLGLVRRAGGELDPAQGLAIAERLGAGACVLGSLVEVERRLHLRAALYRRGQGPEPVAEAAVEGDASQLFELVDALARELLAASRAGPAERIARVGARTTTSLGALKEYLTGEQELRAGRYVAAADAFARASAQDSTFALAHYRLSLASLWADRPGAFPGDADRRAWRHSDRLSARDRRLLEAYLAWRRGSADLAEHLYRDVVAAYPDDVEAWHQLGETLFHYNPLRGRPIGEARGAFEQVLALDPEHRSATWHLAQLEARQGHTREFLRRLERLRQLDPAQEVSLEARALAVLVRRDRRAEARLAPELARADANTLSQLLWRAAVYLEDLEGARRLAGFLTDPHRLDYPRMVGHASLGYLELARGRRAAAEAEIAALASVDPDRWLTLKARAFTSVVPFPSPRPASLAALRDTVAAWADPAEDHRPLQLYYLGLLSDALGDTAGVRAHVAELERALAAFEPLAEVFDPLARRPDAEYRGYAGTLRALLARRSGQPAEALQILERSRVERWYGLAVSSPLHAQGFERFLRAELLRELGRDEEALGWYASFGEHALHDLIYLAPSHLRRAEIHERHENRRAAHLHYGAALELWKDGDPELQPLLERTRQRLAALGGASAERPGRRR
jgi:DNA-binding SARP family transcriptional activator